MSAYAKQIIDGLIKSQGRNIYIQRSLSVENQLHSYCYELQLLMGGAIM